MYTAANLPRRCGIFGASRHGLVCEVPLPIGATHQSDGEKAGMHVWSFIDPATSYEQLHDFFARDLPANEWQSVQGNSVRTTVPAVPAVGALGGFGDDSIGAVQSAKTPVLTFVHGTLTSQNVGGERRDDRSMQIIYGLNVTAPGACGD